MRNCMRYWRSLVGLIIIAIGLFFNWYWMWGILFVLWAISDLRRGSTMLLDDIPRSDCPLLYWIIVLMWLSLALWALSFFNWQSVKQDVEYMYYSYSTENYAEEHVPVKVEQAGDALVVPVKAVETRKQVQPKNAEAGKKKPAAQSVKEKDAGQSRHVQTEKETVREKADAGNRVRVKTSVREINSDRAQFSVDVPPRWVGGKTEDNAMTVVSLESPNGYGTVTILAIDWGVTVTEGDFLQYMQKELQKEFPLMRTAKGIPFTGPDKQKFIRWKGEYKGDPVEVVLNCRALGTYGYVFLGVYGQNDPKTKRQVMSIFPAFKIRKK